MTRNTELAPLLKRLKLSAMLDTLPERIALARREQLDYSSFLEIILVDEINRRDNRRTELRLRSAGFEEICRLEDFDWSASITLDRRLLDVVFSLQFLLKHVHVLLVGPAGVGKSFLAQALGYAAIRAGYTVRYPLQLNHVPNRLSKSSTVLHSSNRPCMVLNVFDALCRRLLPAGPMYSSTCRDCPVGSMIGFFTALEE